MFDVDSWDDKKRRRQNKWEDYLRENNDKKNKITEPIDYFYPPRSLGCSEPCIDLEILKKQEKFVEYKSRQVMHNGKLCQKTYHRIFIKRKL